jgi:hypothetical protein
LKEANVRSRVTLPLWLLLAVVSAAVAVTTTLAPHWLESVFGLDLDGGNGWAEWLIPFTAGALSLVAWVYAAMCAGLLDDHRARVTGKAER